MPDFQHLESNSPFPPGLYEVDIPLHYLESTIKQWERDNGLDLNPDFQRGHVWTNPQRALFVETVLAGGPFPRTIFFASKGWNISASPRTVVLVDGKQRIEAIRMFLRNELPVLGALASEWTGTLRMHRALRFAVADLDRKATLRWYVALNRGSTPHTEEEIERVEQMIARERAP